MRTGGQITFLTIVAAIIIMIAAPKLPIPPHPDLVECYHNSDPENFYCRSLTIATTVFGELIDFIDGHRDLVAALATVVVAWFAFTLWQATHRLSDAGDRQIALAMETRRESERALRITQRAYLAVEPLGIQPLTGQSAPTSVAHIGIKNVGHLPASQVKWAIKVAFDRNSMRPDSVLDLGGTPSEGDNLVVPGVMMVQGTESFQFPENTLDENRPYFLYVYGIVTYHDGFEPDRETGFCHRYNCENLGADGISHRLARFHRFGNRAN